MEGGSIGGPVNHIQSVDPFLKRGNEGKRSKGPTFNPRRTVRTRGKRKVKRRARDRSPLNAAYDGEEDQMGGEGDPE